MASGLSEWAVLSVGSQGDAFYSLGLLRDGQVVAKTITQKDTRGRDHPYAIDLMVSAKMLQTDKAAVLQILNILGTYQMAQKVTALSGETYTSGLTKTWGFKWKLVIDGDVDADRHIEVMADRRLILSHASQYDWDDVLAAVPADGTKDGSDVLTTLVPATCIPAGFVTVEMKGVAGGDTFESAGIIRKAKLTAELLTQQDTTGQSIGYNVKIDVEVEMMQTSTEIAALDTLAANSNGIDWRLTAVDGTVFTFTDQLGVAWEYHNDKDSDDIAFTKVVGSGIISLSAFDSAIS